MNSNKKAAQWAARQETKQETSGDLGKINPCWLRFWEIIDDLAAKLDRLDAAEEATQKATGELAG